VPCELVATSHEKKKKKNGVTKGSAAPRGVSVGSTKKSNFFEKM
jgi:hypothetical protein